MKKPIKIILAVVLILAVCAGAFLLFANGDGGECGNGVKWKYSPINKTLTVSGKGEMFNYNDMGFDPPWFEKYRQAVVLHYLEDLSVAETAKILGVSESAVKMRLSRGREMLKELFGEEENDT